MTYSSEVLADSPLAYWRLADSSGTTAVDSAGSSRDGTYSGTYTLNQASLLTGDSNAATYFEGGEVLAPSAAWMDTDHVTFEAIVKPTGVGASGTRWIGGRDHNGGTSDLAWRLDYASGKFRAICILDGSTTLRVVTGTTTIVVDTTYHVALTYDGTALRLYVNGASEGTPVAVSGVIKKTARPINIGRSGTDAAWVAGYLDELAVYGTALSPARILAHANASVGVFATTITLDGDLTAPTWALTGAYGLESVGPPAEVALDGELSMPIWTLAGAYQFVPLAPVDVTLDGELAAPSWTLVGAYALDPEIIADLAMTGELSAPTWALTGAYDLTAVVLATSVDLIGTLAAPDWTLVGAYEVARPPQTDTGRISGLNLGGYGVATWFPPVVPLPASDDGPKMLVAAAFGPQTMGGTNGTQPVYTISEAHTPRARQQIIVDGEDITGFRNTVTPEVTYQTQEPLLYGPADMVLPQVACTEVFGTGDLSWLRKDANVTVNEVLDDVVTRTLYKGFINAFDISGKTVTVELGGEAHGAMEMENAQVVVVPRINDIGHQAAVDLDKAGIPHHPPLGRVTGIETLTTGGTGLLEHFQAVLAQGWTRAGRKWTVMPDPDTGVYETKRKDDTTIHWTAFIDDARTVLSVRRDTSEEHNRIYGSGVTPRGMRVRNVIIPGLYQGPTPEFPGHMEMGDTGIGVQQLIGKLQQVNYLDLRDTPGGYDEDVYEAVVDLQVDAGMFEDGFTGTAVPGEVNLATWRALYDVDITQQSLGWAHVEPMAQTSRVREWRRSGTGGILGPNPGYDKTVRKRDRNIEFPAGLTRKQQFEFSKAELVEASVENWYGTATFHTGALLRGEVAIGATITDADVMAATEALPGHNLWVPNFMGGTLFHISAAQVAENGIVTATIDTRFRDAMEVWEIMDRNKQAKLDPTRRANQQHRSSTIVKDSIGEWYEHGGILGHDIRLNPGWNVFQVNAAMEGTIARLRLAVQTVTIDGETITLQGHEFALAVFGREITAARLAQIVPAPLTADGKKNWRRKATRDQLKTHWILASFGTDEEPCGYGEDLKSDDAPLTGLIDEDAGFPYRSESRTKLYVAVYVREAAEDATIQAGRIMWPQLESGV